MSAPGDVVVDCILSGEVNAALRVGGDSGLTIEEGIRRISSRRVRFRWS